MVPEAHNYVSVSDYLANKYKEEEKKAHPATPYQLAQLKEKLMRKYCTHYNPAKKKVA